MTDTTIALNRFGLGGRPDETPPDNPRRWLIGQFDRFEARAPAIAAAPQRDTVATGLADYFEELRMAGRRAGPPASAGMPADGMQAERPAPRRRRRAMPPAAMESMAPGAPMAGTPNEMPGEAVALRDPARRFVRRQARDFYLNLVAARTNAALATPAPFIERMSHFWANHFAVSADKLTVIGLAGLLEFDAIRPHVLGKFGDMLLAVEQHPAMLLYLDQAVSIGPDSPAGQRLAGRGRQRRGLNENLAREILELHTLGVDGGYAQADVTEFARALTGWTVGGLGRGSGLGFLRSAQPGAFVFADMIHEPGTRTIAGRSYTQGGEAQARAVLADLAVHPATARHLATKLARHFTADTPPATMVTRLERSYLASGGDLPTVYRAIIESPEVWAPETARFRNPWDWSVAALRAVGTREVQPQAALGLLAQLGQPVWRPGSPAGWDDLDATWAGPDALMRRVEAAERMAGRAGEAIDARQLAPRLLPGALTPATTQAIARAESPAQGLALMLVAPEFLRR